MSDETDFTAPGLSFFVEGLPAPGGSKNGFALKKSGAYTGRVAIVEAGGQRNKNWRHRVVVEARKHTRGILLSGPIKAEFVFFMPRPKAHFTRKGELRPDRPHFHTSKPDVLKLSRSTEDALTQSAWVDDAGNAVLTATKFYSDSGRTGCQIDITPLNPHPTCSA